MKTKYLLAAMALPLFAACTQDEFMGQENESAASALQNRIKVGKVTLTGGEADTRINWETKRWEEGNVLGLFLMDETQYDNQIAVEEENNANKTFFMDQTNWNRMYSLSNYYNTNFPFKFDATDSSWKNDDAVVEGNYFAIAPANNQQDHLKKLTNRRDAWLYINPVQKFGGKENATGELNNLRGGIDENQFFLGYTQIYRNQKLTEGEKLQLPIQMRPILGMLDLAIANKDEMPFKVEKIVISRLDGSPMPTLAYVRPAGVEPEDFGRRQDDDTSLYSQQWNKMANDGNISAFEQRFPGVLKGEAGWQENNTFVKGQPAFAQPYIYDNYAGLCGEELSNSYWSQASWTRTAARSVVEYSYPGQNGFIPYGCTGEMAQPAYEYVLDFTDADKEGYQLNNGDFFHAYVALPHSMYLREYTFTVYGKQYDSARKRWNDGIIMPDFKGSYVTPVEIGENDGRFTLQNVDLSSEKTYLEADIYFDDFRVTRSRIVQTASADDLLKHLKMYYGEDAAMDANKNMLFYVETLGEFTMTNELVDYVRMLNKNYATTVGSKALVYFTRTTGADGYGELVFPKNLNSTDAIDLFYYNKEVNLRNEGEQVINKPILFNYNKSDLAAMAAALRSGIWKDRGIFNDGVDLLDKIEPVVADRKFGGIGTITNVEGAKLTINTIVNTREAENREAILNMEGAELNLNEAIILAGRIDANPSIEDLEDVTYIHNDGVMNMVKSIVYGTVENNNQLNINAKGVSWITRMLNLTDTSCTTCGKENAVVVIDENAALNVEYYENTGTIIADGNLYTNFSLNEGLVEVNADSKISGTNNGTINVTDAELTPAYAEWSTEDLTNTITGVIKVEGKESKASLQQYIGDKATNLIINNGMIYVIGKANIGIERGTGIIDVTDVEGDNYQAKCNTVDDQYFRFRGEASDSKLKRLISSENWGKNKVILEFDKAKTYAQSGDAVAGSKVNNILVKAGATLNIEGTWNYLEKGNNTDADGTLGNSYKACEVEAGANMAVLNDKEVVTAGAEPKAYITINGIFRAENRAIVRNASKVKGNGTVIISCADANFKWIKDSNDLTWSKQN